MSMKKVRLYGAIIALLLGISYNINAQNEMLEEKQKKIITISGLTAKGIWRS